MNYDDELRIKIVNLNHDINEMLVINDRNYINQIRRIRNDTYEFYNNYYFNCNNYTNQAAVNAIKNASLAIYIVERLAIIIDDSFRYNLDEYLSNLDNISRETINSNLNYCYPTLYSNIISTISTERERAVERENLRKLSSPKINDKIDKDFDKIDRGIDKPIKNKPDKKIDQLNEMFGDKIDTFKPKIDRIGGRKKFL